MKFAQFYEQHLHWHISRLWKDKETERDLKRLFEETWKLAGEQCRGIALRAQGVPCETTAADIANTILKEFELGEI